MAQFSSLARVAAAIPACEACPRLRAHCQAVARTKRRAYRDEPYWGRPVPGFGDPEARLLIVGLAPGAHGANRTGRMFTGDSSGDWLFDALCRYGFASQAHATGRDDGLTLSECYISAAARCAPPQNKLTRAELDRCQRFLEEEIRLLTRVQVVVTLGRIGWEAWLRATSWWTRLAARERPVFRHNGQSRLPDGIRLIASYHPSRQNTNTGRLTRDMWYAVFQAAATALEEPTATQGR